MNLEVSTKLFWAKKRVIRKGPRVTRKGPRFAISLFIQKSILLQFLVKWKVVRFYLVNWKVVILLEIIRKFQWIDEMLSYIFNMHVFGNLNENPIKIWVHPDIISTARRGVCIDFLFLLAMPIRWLCNLSLNYHTTTAQGGKATCA